MGILDFLGLGGRKDQAGGGDTASVRRIVSSLDAMDPDRARWTAAFAYLLCRVARADLRVSEDESAAMERILRERGGLDEAQALLVLEIARNQERLFGATEGFLVTREFRLIATREEKVALLDCLYAVSAADESISTIEDNEVVRIASELQLPREEVVAARGRWRDYLAVLKRPTPA